METMETKKIKTSLPVVIAELASLEKEFPVLYSRSKDWNDIFCYWYPKLKELQNITNKSERKRAEYQFFSKVYKNKKPDLKRALVRFRRSWPKLNDRAMLALSEVMEKKWPETDRMVRAEISINPVCPRFIRDRRFSVFYKFDSTTMAAACMHEISHFIYFEKWREVFPKTKEKEFDRPYLVWKLSEMVPAIILNDKRIRKVVDFDFRAYPQFERCKIEGKPLLSYLQDFYDNRKDFADFLRKSWTFVRSHKKKIP